MLFLYSIVTQIVQFLLPLFGFFSPKMKLFVNGRKTVFGTLEQKINSSDKTIVISGEDIFIDPRCVNQEFKKTILQNTKSSRLSIKMIPQTFVNNNDYD